MRGRLAYIAWVGTLVLLLQGTLSVPAGAADPLDGAYKRIFGYPAVPTAECTLVQEENSTCTATWSMSKSSVRVFFHSEFHSSISAYGQFRLEWIDGANRVVYRQNCVKIAGSDLLDDWADACTGSVIGQKHVHLNGGYTFGTQTLRLTSIWNGWCGGAPCQLHGAIYVG